MGENPKFPKVINRDRQGTALEVFGVKGNVKYTGEWQLVEGGKGVDCRTWEVEGINAKVDGADIRIKAGGYTPIQRVNSVDVVIDTPESGKALCVVMDTDGQIYINHFDDEVKGQMEYTEGMYICWIAETEVELTEFESPSFSEEMFTNIDENTIEPGDIALQKYVALVQSLRS
jgi:hypothetical protein